MAGVLIVVSAILLAVSLWAFFGPEPSPQDAPSPSAPAAEPELERETIFAWLHSGAEAELAKFQLPLPRSLVRGHGVCTECNGSRLIWADDPSRDDAKLGICRRCGTVRFDVAGGQVLAL